MKEATAELRQEAESLYKAREKIYPREVSGRYARLRTLSTVGLLGLFYSLPWLRWDGHQALLFDLPARKFYIFGLTFWPQDFFYLAWLLILAALSLFFVTALAGRLWCGYACPQTIWTEIFTWMEQWTEGTRAKRMKLDRSPWTREKILRKSAKQILWITFALFTGFTFVGYFTPIHELGRKLFTLQLGPWEGFWVLFYGLATYGNAGFLREQVCKYMCPYARFQGAMFDRNTLIISYDGERGEPRGGRRRGTDYKARNLGDCIDCTLCVQVCPTGIDIRDGLQYECIACAACIDACNRVMDKMQYPRGLIRYSTQHAMEHEASRVVRPRTLIYGTLLLALIAGFLYSVSNRTPLMVDILRDRNALYREVSGDLIENVYMLKILNMDNADHNYSISASGLEELTVDTEHQPVSVAAGAIEAVPVRLRAPRNALTGFAHDIRLHIEAVDQPGLAVDENTRFLGPLPDDPSSP